MKAWKALLSTSAALAMGIGIAQASAVNLTQFVNTGSYSVTVWSGTGVTDTANIASEPAGTPMATFTYTGNINFINNAPNNGSDSSLNTFADFGFSMSNISGYSGTVTESAFLDTTMSLQGFTDNSYLLFTGSYSSPGLTLTVGHDDGASFYTGMSNGNTVLSSASPVSFTNTSGMLPAGSNSPFSLVYVESNGSPADLVATLSGPALPEPGTLVIFAAGLLGMAWMLRRRRTN